MDRAAEAAGHDAELAALRGRIAAVEAILARPGPRGAPVPPTLAALARRVAALERRGGTLPGLAPLWDAPPPEPADAPPPRAHPAWGELGQGVLAGALLIALVAWLLRPAVGGGRPGPPASTAAPPPAVVVAAPPLAVPAAPAPVPAADPCDEQHPARAACTGGATGPPCPVAGTPATGGGRPGGGQRPPAIRTADRSPGRTTNGARASPTRACVPERYGAGSGSQLPPIRALASADDRRAAGSGRVALGRAPLPPCQGGGGGHHDRIGG